MDGSFLVMVSGLVGALIAGHVAIESYQDCRIKDVFGVAILGMLFSLSVAIYGLVGVLGLASSGAC